MSGQFGDNGELPYINLERIEELRRLQQQYSYYFGDGFLQKGGCLEFGGPEIGNGCERARNGFGGCGAVCGLGENFGDPHARGYRGGFRTGRSVNMDSGRGHCQSPISCSRHFRERSETRYDSLEENRCVICNSSLDVDQETGMGEGLQGRSSRVYSYYGDCLAEGPGFREFQHVDDFASEIGSLANTQGTIGCSEKHFDGEYSDLSDEMEVVINRNNRKVISLALNWISLSGEHNRRIRKFVEDSMDSQELRGVPHFVILFQYDDHKGIRGMYTYFKEQNVWQCVIEVSPNCPKVIQREMIHTLYKFDTSQKLFKPLKDSRRISDMVDGVSIKNEFLH